MLSELEKRLKQEIEDLFSEQIQYAGLWEDLARVCHPRKKNLVRAGTTDISTPSASDHAEQLDITAQMANQTLAGGQMAHITPMGQRWFALEPPPSLAENPAAIRYYSEVTVAIAKALANSNFYNELHEQYLDRGAFGIAALETVAGPEGRGLHFRTYAIGTYAIAEDHFGKVTTIARKYQLTAENAKKHFGEETPLPEPIEKAYASGSREKYTFIHYIKPNPDHQKGNPFSAPILSFDICETEEFRVLRKARYNDLPIAVSRWLKWGENTAYGIGPAWWCLPVAKQTNYLETLGDLLGELAAFPRILAPNTMKGELDLRPNGVSTFDVNMGAQEMPKEWLTQGRYDILLDRLDKKKEVIEAAFYVPLFDLINQQDKQMTAYEVQQRVSEKGALFHPIFVRGVNELTTPVIIRAYSLLAQQPGALPPPPPDVILQDASGPFLPDPEVKYVSPLALAITDNQVSGLPAVIGQMLQIASVDPTAMDSVATENIFPALARANALPETFIRTPEQIAQIQQARQQSQQMAAAEQAANGIQKLGGAQGLTDLSKLTT